MKTRPKANQADLRRRRPVRPALIADSKSSDVAPLHGRIINVELPERVQDGRASSLKVVGVTSERLAQNLSARLWIERRIIVTGAHKLR